MRLIWNPIYGIYSARLIRLVGLVFVLCLMSLSANAAPLPPELRGIVSELFVLEEGYKNQDWELAEQEVVRMRVLFERARPRLVAESKTRAHRDMIRRAASSLVSLSNAIKAVDTEATEQAFLSFNKPILGLVELFEYKEHPILFFIDDALAERIDAVFDDEFDFTALVSDTEDMEEQYKTLWTFIGDLANEQVFGSLFDAIEQLERAAADKNKNKVVDTLGQIQKLNSILRQ